MLYLLVNIGFQVLFHSPPGVLFTFPSRYYSLSVTWSYLALWDGPHLFRQNSSCSDVLVVSLSLIFSPTSLSLSLGYLSRYLRLSWLIIMIPEGYFYPSFGLLRFRSPLLAESFLLSFPPGTKMFQFPGFPSHTLCVQVWIIRYYSYWVPSFGYLRLAGYLLLPVAFRSLSRPSSAPCTKASSVCSL